MKQKKMKGKFISEVLLIHIRDTTSDAEEESDLRWPEIRGRQRGGRNRVKAPQDVLEGKKLKNIKLN